MNKKTLIICASIHHGNTWKLAEVMANRLQAELKRPHEATVEDIESSDLVGFGSGIYDDKHHIQIFNLVEKLSAQKGKKAFIFTTSGVPIRVFTQKFFDNYTHKCHGYLGEKLTAKGFEIVGEFSRPGYNTNVFLKYLGGLNKGRPNAQDLEDAAAFAEMVGNK